MQIIDQETARIAVSKGDSAYFTVELEGNPPEDGTTALFSIKKEEEDRARVLKKFKVENGAVWIGLTSRDTNRLEPGNYLWDLRLILSKDHVDTPIPPTRFLVMGVVGDV